MRAACTRPAQLGAGVSVAARRLGAVVFTSSRSGVALTASEIPCVYTLGDLDNENTEVAQPVLLAVTSDGGLHWHTTGSVIPTGQEYDDQQVAAVDGQQIWMVNSGVLFATRDHGRTWTPQPVPVPVVAAASAGGWLWVLSCPAVGQAPCHPAAERMKLPGGRWIRTSLTLPAGPESMQLTALSADDGVIAVSGQHTALVSTADGGVSWSVQPPPPGWLQQCVPDYIGSFTTWGPRDWYLLCEGGLYRSRNAGHTWAVVGTSSQADTMPFQGETALAAATPTQLWAALENGVAGSRDGGLTWPVMAQIGLEGDISQFDVLSATHCWLLAPGLGLWGTTNGAIWRQLGSQGPS
jgi:photosystem II stability/assembly factor-like uncharacterized protein